MPEFVGRLGRSRLKAEDRREGGMGAGLEAFSKE